jgi:hypothetical protein
MGAISTLVLALGFAGIQKIKAADSVDGENFQIEIV